MMVSFESLGVLVFRRQLDLQLVDDFVSGSLVLSWRKLERYVIEERAARGRDTLLEWFQWLAERDRKSTRLNSSHVEISYAVFCAHRARHSFPTRRSSDLMMVSFESLGVLVFRRQLDLQLVDDFVSGSLVLSWRKLERYVIEERAARGRDTLLEWFQWLAE